MTPLPAIVTAAALLVPAPDVLLTGDSVLLSLPASLRPATFFVQGVAVGSSLTTMRGYTVSAF